MEKPGYRLNLERLNEIFPDREMLRKGDIVRLEHSSYQSVSKRYIFNRNGMLSKSDYARQISV